MMIVSDNVFCDYSIAKWQRAAVIINGRSINKLTNYQYTTAKR